MSECSMLYQLVGANWSLRFSEQAIALLSRHVQRGRWSKESVGQLYTRDLTASEVVVNRVTVLSPTSASWGRVRFDTKQAMAERVALFSEGYHCLGLWHTHPEPRPTPSPKDRRLARDHALAAQPQLAGLLFAILGNDPIPFGLRVWVDDGSSLEEAGIVDFDGKGAATPGPKA